MIRSKWVIFGRNGSGKSGVVDAIEFGLTGAIKRLSGEGSTDVSVKKHGPHVDNKNNPNEAEVEISLISPANKEFKLTRNCKYPDKFQIEPRSTGKLIRFGSEVILTRREILSFILTTPGDRSKKIQSLLKIDKIEEVRSAFSKLKRDMEKDVSSLRCTYQENKK